MMEFPAQLSSKSARASFYTVCIALLIAMVTLIVVHAYLLSRAIVEDSTVQTRIIADNVVAAVLFKDVNAATEMLASLSESPSVTSAFVISKDGHILATYKAGSIEIPSELPKLVDAGYELGLQKLRVTQPIYVESMEVGYVVTEVTLSQLHQRLLTYALITLSIFTASVGGAFLFVRRSRRILAAAEEHLHQQAHVDATTGLLNRNAFNNHLAKIASHTDVEEEVTELLLFDLDNFKVVNDTLGHNNGDRLLAAVAKRLQRLAENNEVVFRVGGDEFAIVRSSNFQADAEVLAQRIIDSVSMPYSVESHQLHITCSVGIARCLSEGMDVEVLTRNADTAMYHAKGKGKNTYAVFAEEMNQRMQRRALLESNLRRAIATGDEFSVVYQPKLSLITNKITGMEALLRWNHPVLGSISPAEFIPVAEDSGLVSKLGDWVLKTVCNALQKLNDIGYGHVSIAMNLSVKQIANASLVSDIKNCLNQSNIQPKQLCLEITESVLMEKIEATIAVLNELRALGVTLSIDDFGTGYSSMAYLKTLKIDELKIDRAFIKDLPQDDDKSIITAMIALGHSLGLSVVAEGVETDEQLSFLRESGCDCIQGYYFSRPMEFEKICKVLSRQ